MDDNIKLYNLLDGEIPSSAIDLPPPDTKRWVTRRKAVIVNAVRTGVISLEEVCRRYELSVEEFLAWQRAIDTHGVPGLRVTRLQIYRDNPPSRLAKPRSLVGATFPSSIRPRRGRTSASIRGAAHRTTYSCRLRSAGQFDRAVSDRRHRGLRRR